MILVKESQVLPLLSCSASSKNTAAGAASASRNGSQPAGSARRCGTGGHYGRSDLREECFCELECTSGAALSPRDRKQDRYVSEAELKSLAMDVVTHYLEDARHLG